MTRYAQGTSVSTDRSLGEIRKILARYGAMKFGLIDQPGSAAIGFEMQNRAVKIVIPLPKVEDCTKSPSGRARTRAQAEEAMRAEECQRWRALALIIKAKCEVVESGIITFEREWLPYLVLPNGQTVADKVAPELAGMFERGRVPPLLLDYDRDRR
jgi:hypothetical protein